MKCMVIPVIIGATGIVAEGLRKNFSIFTTTDSYTKNITHSLESTAVCNVKPERWGTALVREQKYRGEKACDKR